MRKPYYRARIWWCEDEICDYHQPQIDLVKENPKDSRFNLSEEIWRGRFASEGDMEGMVEELKTEAG